MTATGRDVACMLRATVFWPASAGSTAYDPFSAYVSVIRYRNIGKEVTQSIAQTNDHLAHVLSNISEHAHCLLFGMYGISHTAPWVL